MPTSYDGTLLDHLAEHNTIYLSLCWLSHCLSSSSRCATLLSSLCASLLSHCLSSSSCCALLSSSRRAGWLLRRLSTRRPLVVSLSRRAALSSSRPASWLSCHLLSSSLVGIDVFGTPDLGRGGAHAGGVASRREEVHPLAYSRAISSSSISISPTTTGLPSPSCHYRAFRRRSVAVAPSIAVTLAPSIACRRCAAADKLPPTLRCRAAATAADAAAVAGRHQAAPTPRHSTNITHFKYCL